MNLAQTRSGATACRINKLTSALVATAVCVMLSGSAPLLAQGIATPSAAPALQRSPDQSGASTATIWVKQPGMTDSDFGAIWGAQADDVWAVGWNGTIARWNGTAWAYWLKWEHASAAAGARRPDDPDNLHAIWGSDANNIWAVGDNNIMGDDYAAILRWNGAQWQRQDQTFFVDDVFFGVWGTDPNNVWAVGSGGSLHWDGATWSLQDATPLRDVWGSSTNDIWGVGNNGLIQHWDGAAWVQHDSGTLAHLNAVYGIGQDNVWAVGDAGTILKWNGLTWSSQDSAVDVQLNSVWAADAEHVWAVGDQGYIVHWDGAQWRIQASGHPYSLNAIWGFDQHNIWIVGQEIILRAVEAIPLQVQKTGAGQGTVVSVPPGIVCGDACSGHFSPGSTVTLVAAAPDATFAGWSGACTGSAECSVSLHEAQTVTATFGVASQPVIQVGGQFRPDATVWFSATLGLSTMDSCLWDFGNGAAAACNGRQATDIAVHAFASYTATGVYTAAITAENAAGAAHGSAVITITEMDAVTLPLIFR